MKLELSTDVRYFSSDRYELLGMIACIIYSPL